MKIYFLGICGTAMGNVARLMKSLGHEVAGNDSGIYPPMSDFLKEAGIAVEDGFEPDALAAFSPDRVVVGNVLTRGNPCVEYLLEKRPSPFLSLPELIREQLLSGHHSVVVAGTHGKTTTAALTAYLLREAGADPGWMIGGIPLSLESGCALGKRGGPFVIEGDEYDSAFFDKRSKFIHYQPRTLVLNNLEFDHSDIFRDLEDVRRSFSHLLRLVPPGGQVITNGDDANLESLFPLSWTRVLRVGTASGNDLRIVDFSEDADGSRFQLCWQGRDWAEICWPLAGAYNARNAAMAALATARVLELDDPTTLPLESLSRFRGVRRRQEVRRQEKGLILVEDFGHHPTAIRETLRSYRQRYPEAHLIAGFEPRSNTSATRILQTAWENAFLDADSLWLAPIHRAERIPPDELLDRQALVRAMEAQGGKGFAFTDFPSMEAALRAYTESRSDSLYLIILFSNGGFGGLVESLSR